MMGIANPHFKTSGSQIHQNESTMVKKKPKKILL